MSGLRNLDLNLLIAFDLLMREHSVSRAAERMSVTQSAMSHMLGRLRQLFNDELLIRTGTGMQSTLRAQKLIGKVRKILGEIEGITDSAPHFEPSITHSSFIISTIDYIEFLLLPSLSGYIRQLAPNIDISIIPPENSKLEMKLENREIDMMIGFSMIFNAPTHFHSASLFHDRFVCVVRRDHPFIGDTISLDEYLRIDHILISTPHKNSGLLDLWFEKNSLNRRIGLALPHFLSSLFIVAQTDMIVTLPFRIAMKIAQIEPLKILSRSKFCNLWIIRPFTLIS